MVGIVQYLENSNGWNSSIESLGILEQHLWYDLLLLGNHLRTCTEERLGRHLRDT
jgi:hypothetical protein